MDEKTIKEKNLYYRGKMRKKKHTFKEKFDNFIAGVPLTFYEPDPVEYGRDDNWKPRDSEQDKSEGGNTSQSFKGISKDPNAPININQDKDEGVKK